MEHIVYIHGLNCSGKIFTHIHERLPEHSAQFIEYNSCERVEDSFQTAYEEITDDPIWLIGHSLGGILCYLLALRAKDLNIKGVVSISTPFGGSNTAGTLRWFFSSMPVLEDLSPGSKIIKEVTTNKVKVPFTSVISVAGNLPFIKGENDGVVTVASQRASLAKKKVDVFANHFEVVQDNKTVKTIEDFIFK